MAQLLFWVFCLFGWVMNHVGYVRANSFSFLEGYIAPWIPHCIINCFPLRKSELGLSKPFVCCFANATLSKSMPLVVGGQFHGLRKCILICIYAKRASKLEKHVNLRLQQGLVQICVDVALFRRPGMIDYGSVNQVASD